MDDQSFVKLGSNQLRAGDHSVVVFFTSVIPLFSSLTSFESTEPQLLVVAGIIVYVFQHIGFLINAHFSDVLGYILGGDIANIFYGFHFPLYDPLFVYDAKPTSLIALVYVTFALGLLLVTLTMFYRTTGSDTDKKNPAFVLVNRLVLHGMSTFLLIPMLQVCLAGMVCGDQWSLWHYAGRSNVDQSTIQCWGSNHLATFIPSALFTAAILPMIYLTIGCQFETRNSSDHLKARRNSFVDEIVFAHDVISCVLFQVLLAYNKRGAFAIAHAASACVVSGAYAYYLPFYDLNMNQFFAAVHAVEGAISVIVAAALLNPSFAMSASASAMIIGLAPFGALYAAVLAAYRVHPLFVHLMQQCKSGVRPYLETSKVPFPKGLADDTNFAPFPDLEEQVVECVTRQDAHAATEDLKRPPLGGGGGGRDGRDSVSGGEGSTREMDPAKRQCEILAPFIEVVRVPADVDLAASFPQVFERVMGDKPTLRMLVVASKIFSRGIVTFPNNSFILYRFASFIVEYIPTMSFVGLELIENMSHIVDTSIILRYRAYHTAQELRMALGIRNQAHLLHSKRARQKHSGVLTLMHSFWMKLTEPSVNIGQVSEIADQINGSRQEALAQFRRALQHQTTSDALLVHRMGDFLRDIMMDHEGATECHNEAKEIHEARQARSMRGTKQHTTVELDVETLTDRLMTLLEGKRDNNANSSAGHSGVVQYLLFGVTIIFLALLAISALFLYVSIDQHTKMNNSVEHIQRMAGLRHEANQFGASLLGALAATTTATRAPFFTLMAQELSTFSSEFAAVTSGEYQTKHKPQVQLLTDAMVPAYIDTPFGDSNSGYALWTLTEQLISHMKTIVQYGNTTTLSNNDPHVKFVLDATMPTSYSYDYMVSLAEGYISDESSTVTIWSIVLMVVGVVIVVLTYLAFLVSFRRTALSRIFTFQLFTLIPFDDLEKLASDTKEKVQAIIAENMSTQQQQQQQDGGDGGQGGDGTSSRAEEGAAATDLLSAHDDSASSASSRKASVLGGKSLFALEYNGVALKSCLKKGPKANKGAKKVAFNAVVETVGGKEDDAPASLTVRKGDPLAKHADDDADSDEPLLLEKKAGDGARRPRTAEGYSAMEKTCFMVAFGSIVAICAVSMILLGLSYNTVQNASTSYESMFDTRINVWNDLSDSVVAVQSQVLKFIFTGSEVNYNNYVTVVVALQGALLSSVGVDKDNVAAVTDFSHQFELLMDRQLDAIALAARFFGTDLKESPLLKSRVVGSTDAAFALSMQTKYPDTYITAARRNAGIGAGAVSMLDLAWAIISIPSTSCDLELNSHLLAILSSFNAKAQQQVDDSTHPHTTTAALALLALCAVLTLCMMTLDIDVLTSDHVGRLHFAVLFALMAIPIGITASAWREGDSATTAANDGYYHMNTVLGQKTGSNAWITQTRMYAISGLTSYFFCAQSQHPHFDATLQNLTPFLKDAGLMTSAVANQLTMMYNDVAVINRLSDIGTSLAIAGYANYVTQETSMTEFLGNNTWSYFNEEEYRFTEQMFPGRTPKYSDRSTDLTTLTPAQQVSTAMATVLDARATLYVLDEQMYFAYLLGNVSEASRTEVTDAVHAASVRTIVALATCAIPILWCIFIAVRLAFLFTLVLGLQASTNTNSMDMSVYTVLVRRCQYALLIIAALLGLTFALGIWVSQTSERPFHELNLATKRNYYISRSLYHVRALFTNASEAISAQVLLDDARNLKSIANDVYFGDSSSGKFYAAGSNGEFDYLTFGPEDPVGTASVLQSYLTDVCSSLITGGILPVASRNSFGDYPNPTQLGVFYWRVLLGEIAELFGELDPTAQDMTRVQQYAGIISGMSEALESALSEGDQVLYNKILDNSKLRSGVFIAASALAIVTVIAVYFLVMLPVINRLVDEEESAKLLLRMIPVHVRDQVPAISEFIETGKIDNAAELQKKFEASEKLLQNILPLKIANRLKSGEQPIADTHPCLTILFTDFVGFTKRSSNMRADEIVDFLNEVFLEFDTIVELLELEKIKTIGDAYFMAGGLDPRISDHAMRVIEAGIMFYKALEEHNARHPDRNILQMRLGIHTGPAVAGVIGTKKVAYDLWGESVEIANAMESTGIPGRVHISEDTAKHVTGFYRLENRGELPREKEHIPDTMPATFLITGRLLPTPYQHIQRPRMVKQKLAGDAVK